jgi:hypothetical protein
VSGLFGPRRPKPGLPQTTLPELGPGGLPNYSLPNEAFLCLERRFPAAGRLLELGSGAGTGRLIRQGFEVTSIEHDEGFLDRYGSTYIYAPLVNGWYDVEAVRAALDRGPYDVIIVDGPPGVARLGLLFHADLFPVVPMLFDDTQRGPDRRVAAAIAKRHGARLRTYRCAQNRTFTTVGF